MTWLVAGASLFATWLNVGRVRLCFAIWFGTNVAWAMDDFSHGLPAQGVLMTTYALLAIWGWFAWSKSDA